jgi:steroid 5-alpha reductase family enzyme
MLHLLHMIHTAFALAAELIFVYMTGMFLLSLLKKDNSIVDIAYGLGFVIVAWSTLLVFGSFTLVQLLVTSLITIWGLRLSTRIYFRNKGKPEDFRYKKWHDEWTWFKTRSFFQIYMLQGLIILGISSVSIFINSSHRTAIASHGHHTVAIVLMILGTLAWFKGFFFESVGDYQLDQFIKKQGAIKAAGQTPTKTVMNEGLWSMTLIRTISARSPCGGDCLLSRCQCQTVS